MNSGPFRPMLAASTAIAMMFAAGVGTAAAQDTQQQMQQPPQMEAPSAAELDEPTLQAFAEASLEVDQLVEKWSPRLEEAGSEQEAQQIQQEANMEMAQAVQSAGIDVDTYNEIHVAARQDQELAATIQQYRQQAQ